jgi:hypothetical protein
MKKLALILALLMSLSCLLMACDTPAPDATDDTTVETTAPATEAPTEAPTETPTEAPTEAPSTKVTYTVTVKDQNGNPVEGAAVQMCDDKGCKMPAATNAEGVVTFTYDPSNYHITIVECPEGYTCDPEQAFYFEGEATELTVEITKN